VHGGAQIHTLDGCQRAHEGAGNKAGSAHGTDAVGSELLDSSGT
jgi:hypothetical protein